MASALLYFNLLEGGLPAKSSYTVYLDSSLTAVENSYYYDYVPYSSRKLTGTNGFSAFTEQTLPDMSDAVRKAVFRIRILYGSELSFCSAWFKYSNDGYEGYIPYSGSNGSSNGLYTIVVPNQYSGMATKQITVTTTLYDVPSPKKKIPCTIYLFWGGSYLNGGALYPPIIGRADINIGDRYSIKVPSSTSSLTATNYVSYSLSSHNVKYPNSEHSYFNSYGLDGQNFFLTLPTGSTEVANILFSPQKSVICTGQMAESISYNGSEFAGRSTQCLTVGRINASDFKHSETDTGTRLIRFSSIQKKNSIILNTVFVTNGKVENMAYKFSGNSTTFTTNTTAAFPSSGSVSGCNWQAYVSYFLNTAYNSTDLDKKVTVSIQGGILSIATWYFKVVAYDGTIIQGTRYLTRNSAGFTTTIGKLDGAIVFFGGTPSITANSWAGAKKATDGSNATITTKNVYSWAAASTTSLESIGEFDYE